MAIINGIENEPLGLIILALIAFVSPQIILHKYPRRWRPQATLVSGFATGISIILIIYL